MSEVRSGRPRVELDEEQRARNKAIVADHVAWLHQDPDFWEMPEQYRHGRENSEKRGLYTFLEAEVWTGEYVEAEYRAGQEDLQIQGALDVFQPDNRQHPLWIFVGPQRIRFRALNWIRKAEDTE